MCVAIWYDISISRNSKQFLLPVTQSYFSKIVFFFFFLLFLFRKFWNIPISAGICLLYSLDRNIIFLTNTVFRHWRSQDVLERFNADEIVRPISYLWLNQFLIFIFLINLRSCHRRTSPLFIYPPRTTSSIHLIFPIDKKFLVNRPQINLPRTNKRWKSRIHTVYRPFSRVSFEEFSKEIPRKTIYVFSSCHWNLAEHIRSSSLLILTLHD